MAQRSTTLNHHRRTHNGKHRVRKGDVFQARPRPCLSQTLRLHQQRDFGGEE